MNRGTTLFLVVICSLVLGLGGCGVSLHSSQYDFVKGLFEQDVPPPRPNWRLTWQQQDYSVYAINQTGGTLFANEEGFAVSFDGWQVIKFIVPGIGVQRIASIGVEGTVIDDRTLSYKDKTGALIETHKCDVWRRVNKNNDASSGAVWMQSCSARSEQYKNVIRMNNQGQWVKLEFTVIPGDAPLVLIWTGADMRQDSTG